MLFTLKNNKFKQSRSLSELNTNLTIKKSRLNSGKNKTIFLSLTLTAAFALLTAFQNTASAQRFSNALEYMQHIGNQYKLIAEDTWSYTRAVAKDKSAKKLEAKRKELIVTTKSAKYDINRMPDWEGDAAYRDSVVAALDLSLLMLTEDYAKIVDLEEIAEQSYDFMEAYLMAKEAANEKQSKVNQAVADEQKRFAEENDITLVESDDELSKNLEAANEMFSYYNDVYLVFFKSYLQEGYLIEAAGTGDMSAIEQNKSALESYAQEGRDKLNALGNFKGDLTLKTACLKLMDFYLDEATTKGKVMTDFFLEKERFEKIAAALEGNKRPSQEEVDQYNEALESYNILVDKFNANNEALNKSRKKLLDNWNKTANTFLSKHVTN